MPDILRTAIGATHRVLGEHAGDLVWLVKPERLTLSQTCCWQGVIGRDRDAMSARASCVFGVDLVQLRRHRRQAQALLTISQASRNAAQLCPPHHAEIAQGLEGPKLIERMQADRSSFSAIESSSAMPPSRTTHAPLGLAIRFCFTGFESTITPPPAGT